MIFFDVGNTLLEVNPSVGAVYTEVGGCHGVTLDPAQINSTFKSAFADAPPLSFPNCDELERQSREYEWWKAIVRRAVPASVFSLEDFEAFYRELYETFARGSAWRVFDDVRPTLDDLKSAGFRLGV